MNQIFNSIPKYFQQDSLRSLMARCRIRFSVLIAVIFLCLVLVTRPLHPNSFAYEIIEAVGFLLIGTGTIGRIWCSIYISGKKNKTLCRLGPYSMVQNPLYLFSYIGMLGVFLGTQNLLLALFATVIYWAYYYPVINNESETLLGIFGEQYIIYRAQVPRYFPKFNLFKPGTNISIKPNKILTDLVDAGWFTFAIFAIEIIEYAKGISIHGIQIIPTLWQLPF